MESLTDADLSRLITLVVIHEGESSSMNLERARRLMSQGMVALNEDSTDWFKLYTVTPQGRALVERMLAAGRANG